MATIIRKEDRDYQPNQNKIDGFRLFTDISREKKGINPQYLNFDLRQLNPRQYSAPYHFHRYAEEMFLILSGSATLRTPDSLGAVHEGEIIFFEAGETGAHQLYNHTEEPCTYLDLRSYIGHDVCEYPDSDKILLTPNGEVFRRSKQYPYFDGETDVDEIWDELRNKRDEEESTVGLEAVVPFLLESKLIERGAKFEKSATFQPHVTVDQRLITRQNPQSAEGVGKAMLQELRQPTTTSK